MGFANLSTWAVAGGLAALAAVLYALQRLRIRLRERQVATLLFWKAALNESPARTLMQRFRHVWAYLLILSICSLIWLAIAEPEWRDRHGDDFYVLLLDGSAGMAREGRFEQALEELERDLDRLPPDRRQVLWSGARAETLLRPGEHALLLPQRLAGRAPEAVPSSLDAQLTQLASIRRDGLATQIRVYGDAPVSAALLADMPAGVSVTKASRAAGPVADNAGITALGVEQAASGRWGFVDLLFRVEGDAASRPAAEQIDVAIDGATLPAGSLAPDTDGITYRVADLPAGGGLLSVVLNTVDSLALDNRAEIRLPEQQTIRVQLSAALPAVIASALRADSAIEFVESDPDVVIRNRGETLGGRAAALEFVGADRQEAAFVLGYPEHAGANDAAALLAAAVRQIGLDNIDATGLAEVARRPLQVTMRPDGEWTVSVWRELLSDDYNLIRSRSFPLFVAQSVRWLAGVRQWYPWIAAGRPLPSPLLGSAAVLADADGTALDTVGADFVPSNAGTLQRLDGGAPLEVSLLDSDTTAGATDSALAADGPAAFGGEAVRNSLAWLLLLALVGLSVEWWLYQKGRLP